MLGHVCEKGLAELKKQDLFGNDKIKQLIFCEHCVQEKKNLCFNARQ